MLGHSREHARVFSLEILHAPRDSRADARREYTRSYISRGTYKELRIHVRTHVRIAYLYSQTLSLSLPPSSYFFLLFLALPCTLFLLLLSFLLPLLFSFSLLRELHRKSVRSSPRCFPPALEAEDIVERTEGFSFRWT